jgi:hypothetical protein
LCSRRSLRCNEPCRSVSFDRLIICAGDAKRTELEFGSKIYHFSSMFGVPRTHEHERPLDGRYHELQGSRYNCARSHGQRIESLRRPTGIGLVSTRTCASRNTACVQLIAVALRIHEAQSVKPRRLPETLYRTCPGTSAELHIQHERRSLADSTKTTGSSIVLAIVIPSVFAIVIVILITS